MQTAAIDQAVAGSRSCGDIVMVSRPRLLACVLLLLAAGHVVAEDGYDLWLRYPALDDTGRTALSGQLRAIAAPADPSPGIVAAIAELRRGLSGLVGQPVPVVAGPRPGAVLLGTPRDLPAIGALDLPLTQLGDEGFLIRSVSIDDMPVTVVTGNTDTAVLYGAFELLRQLQTAGELRIADIVDVPQVKLRLLNHWDNLDRHVERGYAGESIWDWWRLPDHIDSRYEDYARANASLGINGTVLNNVNAQAEVLLPRYIDKAAALADVFRPYGLRIYLSVRFSAPVDIGGLDTADPLDPEVRAWWRDKATAIYARIPDFGGFLVKANSEGQPGPQNYGRGHVDGANMLAAALAPHGGVVMWRAFVYSEDDPEDRVRQAYSEFKPLDGRFADNVLVQVKNGPLDFQPREPFHPLFGAMPGTPLLMEFQITQEYLGFSTHLVYLGALWAEVLAADPQAAGEGSTVARIVDGSVHGNALTGIAGVANIGSSRNWTGAPFTQANWYAFGRLAWNPQAAAPEIAKEWLQQTFTRDPAFVDTIAAMMMQSREAVVDYMTPLGLAHIMGTGHHYGPAPWVDNLSRPEWNPVYYHRADNNGIGFDRTTSGSNAVAQYAPGVAAEFADLKRVPEEYLLWFHRVPWDYRMRSGDTLWEALVARYDRGVEAVERMQKTWAGMERFVDTERFVTTKRFLAVQEREARWWRDACIAYFQERSGLPLPAGTRPPAATLDYYKALEFPYAPGN